MSRFKRKVEPYKKPCLLYTTMTEKHTDNSKYKHSHQKNAKSMYNPASNYAAYEQGGIVIDPQGVASGSDRVLRGGSWGSRAKYCTVGRRQHNDSPGVRYYGIGFRLAWCP